MKKLRNILAMLMVFVMLVAVLPMNVFAEGEGKTGNGDDKPVVTEPADPEKPADPTKPADPEKSADIEKVEITATIVGELKAGNNITNPTFAVKDDTATVTLVKWYKGDAEASEKFEEGKYTYTFTIAPKKENAKFADNLTVTLNGTAVTAETIDNAKVYRSAELEVKPADSTKPGEGDKKPGEDDKKPGEGDKKPEDKPVTPTPVKTVKVVTFGNGTASVNNEYAIKGQSVTVTAKPYSGYAVARVYLNYAGITKNINTYYNGYYYDGRYYGRYNDYYKYLDEFNNSNYHSYREFLRHEYPRHYRYYEDYDYWTDRYDYDWYDRYDNYYYKYLDDFRRSSYDTYEEYLRAEHYGHYRDYYNYRYDYNWYNRYGYNTSDTFEMPASNVTVYVEFTDAYPYYYDDYYYYRYRRDKKDKVKEEKAEEEEKVVEKTPQVFEASATINVGSNVFTKVNKNVTTQHQMDVAAYVKNGRVMLPLRYVAEALGLQVSWVPETKTVIIWDLTQRVEIPIKSNKMIVNGVTYTSDVKPEINNSRTMLPIANVARALGLIDGTDIIWDPVMKQVNLTRRVLSK